MKNAAKKWYNYIIALAITSILFCCAYTPYKITKGTDWPAKYVCYFLIFSGVVVSGVGFIIQDLYKGHVRHKISDWDNKLDDKYLNKAWAIFFPMLFGGLLSIIIGIVSNFFVK